MNGNTGFESHFVAEGCSSQQSPQLTIWCQGEMCPCIFYTVHPTIALHGHVEHNAEFFGKHLS